MLAQLRSHRTHGDPGRFDRLVPRSVFPVWSWWLGVLLVTVPGPALAAGVMVGDGSAVVTQSLSGQPGKWLEAEVSVLGAYATDVGAGGHSTVFRFQFVRPDSKGVAFAVFTLPPGAFAGTFPVGATGAGLIYYEIHPDHPDQKLFLADHASGEIAVSSALPTEVKFSLNVTQEAGKKDVAQDDEARQITDAGVWFFGPGDLSKVEYYYDPYYDEVYYSNDVYVIYDDGCTGGPDDYDDSGTYDDTDYYDDGGGDYSGDSCDGDVYDGGSSDWSDDSSDASCDYDDSGSDDSSSSGSSSSGDSGWEGDDWAASSSDDEEEDDDDDSGVEGDTWRMRGMSWFAPLGKLVRAHRRAMRAMPLLLAVGILLLLRRFGGRATSACGR